MSSSGLSITLSASAYIIPILHAAAHPSSTTIGVFLSPISTTVPSTTSTTPSTSTPSTTTTTPSNTIATTSGPSTTSSIQITDAIPLIHAHTTLSPILEIALEHVIVHAREKGSRVVGMYIAEEAGGGGGRIRERIMGGLKGLVGDDPFSLVIDEAKLAKGENPYILYTAPSSKPIDGAVQLVSKDLPSRSLQSIKERRLHATLYDFDDHLDDSSVDWLGNTVVVKAIESQVAGS